MPRGNKDTILQKNQETAQDSASSSIRNTNNTISTASEKGVLMSAFLPMVTGAGSRPNNGKDRGKVARNKETEQTTEQSKGQQGKLPGIQDNGKQKPVIQENHDNTGKQKKKKWWKYLTVTSEDGTLPNAQQTAMPSVAHSKPLVPASVGAGLTIATGYSNGSMGTNDASWRQRVQELQQISVLAQGVLPPNIDEIRKNARAQMRAVEEEQARVREQRRARRKAQDVVEVQKTAGAKAVGDSSMAITAGDSATAITVVTEFPKLEAGSAATGAGVASNTQGAALEKLSEERFALRDMVRRRKLVRYN